MDTILGRQNVQQLPADQQQQARSEAMRRFVLGSLLGGRGLASGYSEAQQVIPGIQAANQRQREAAALESAMVPTGVRPGSQIDMLQQQTGEEVLDPRTVQSLQRNARGSGVQGTGLTEAGQFMRQFDPTLYSQVAPTVMSPSDPKAILDVSRAGAPDFDATTGVSRNPFTGEILSSIERPGTAPGTAVRVGQTGEMSVRALPGAAQAAEMARPIDLAQGEVIIGYDLQGGPIVQNAQGVIQSRFQREAATAQGQATGQVERVFDPQSGTEVLVPRSAITGGGAGMGGGQAGGGRGVGGFATGPGLNEQVLQQAGGEAFVKRVARVNEVGQDAGQRAFRANELYNTVSEIDPTALTAIGATVVPYIRAIPGFREITDNFATNTALLGQQYARGALGNFAMVKGNLNAQEVRLVENATWQKWDPRTATRYIAALEAAFADKDASQMEFANTYQGNFREYDSAWRTAPQNQSVFNHPMMTRFVNDEVREAMGRGVEPNLPPGFKAEISQSTGRVRITKPDGTTTMME
jgi:hypothetical protein